MILEAARELLDARQFSGVAAVCGEALLDAPDDLDLRLMRARALLALRREVETQVELSFALRIEPRCGAAYRMLGELAAHKDELSSARVFLREALRLCPEDEEATVWLAIVESKGRRTPTDPRPEPAPSSSSSSSSSARPTPPPIPRRPLPPPLPWKRPGAPVRAATVRASRASPPPVPARAREVEAQPSHRPLTPLPAGFGTYLVDVGVLSELELRAAMAYKKATSVRLGAAAVALGFATEARLESASLVYNGHHRRGGADVIATARA